MLLRVFDEIAAQVCADWDWHIALEVAAAVSGATGATVFVRVEKSSVLRAIASTLPDERRESAARAIEHCDADSPPGRGASLPVTQCSQMVNQGAWWRVPIRDGGDLVGALYLEYGEGGEPSGRVLRNLAEWARAAAHFLKGDTAPHAPIVANEEKGISLDPSASNRELDR